MQLKLKDVCKLMRGRHSPRNDNATHWNHSNGKLWLRIGDLKDQTYDTTKKLSDIGVELIKNHNRFIFKKNSIALSCAGKGSIGKLGWLMNDFYASGAVTNITAKNNTKITNKYLYFFLTKNQKKIIFLEHGTTSQLRISKTQLENFEINLPNFEKQKKIVEWLDAMINSSTKYLQQITEEKEKIIKIQKFLIEQKIRKNTKLGSWKKTKLKNICKLMRGRHSPEKDVAEHWDYLNGKPWLRIGDLKDQTYDTIKKLSNIGVELIKNHNQFIFKKNSIALSCVGKGSIGKLGWLMNDFYASGAIINITTKNNTKTINKYLYYFFIKNKKKIISLQHGTTGLLKILKTQLENFEIDLPEFKIQKQTVGWLDEMTTAAKKYLLILNKEQKIILKLKKLMLQYKII